MNASTLPVIFAFIVLGRLILRFTTATVREVFFALLNLAAVYWIFFKTADGRIFPIYLAWVMLQYATLARFSQQRGAWPWLAFAAPITALIAVRYGPAALFSGLKLPGAPALFFAGLSYLAFRSSQLVMQVRNGVVALPGFWRYLSFCFFLPTLQVGPISPYSEFNRAFTGAPVAIPVATAGLRVVVGAIKYQYLGVLCNQLTYASLLRDDHYHPWSDLPVAMFFYYLYLYCNFSGFCDMAIGAAGLVGIPVAENFDNPFAARNVKDFWNRWHITLSAWMRDVVFSPLSKFLVGKFGLANANHAIALTITCVFLLVGVWHGVGWNFAAYGAAHALGVVVNHYYTLFLKKRLGRDGFKAYNENRWIHAAAVALTFCYCGASLIFFANTFPQIKQIFSILE
jgi:D-alanyl-lipoteichoic acid acyltransferase DltB (MBOAT superfamily)